MKQSQGPRSRGPFLPPHAYWPKTKTLLVFRRPRDPFDNLFRNTLLPKIVCYTEALGLHTFLSSFHSSLHSSFLNSFFPSLLFRIRNLILYIPFGRHIVFVFDSLLRRKCSNFRRFKQESEEFGLEAGRKSRQVFHVVE